MTFRDSRAFAAAENQPCAAAEAASVEAFWRIKVKRRRPADGVPVALWAHSPGEQEENELQVSRLLPLRGRAQGQLSVVEGIDPVSSHTHRVTGAHAHTLKRTD